MRTLTAAPDDALDPATLEPRLGSYRGSLRRIEVGRAARGPLAGLTRLARGKRWLFVAIARDPILVSLAVVRLGYASNAFAFVYHAGERRMLADASSLGPSFAADVSDTAGLGAAARYRLGRFRAAFAGDGAGYTVAASARGFDLHARLDATAAPPSVTAIAPVPRNLAATTEKRALLTASGEVTAAGQRFILDEGFAAYDYTQGLFARRTAWHWALALGLAKGGEPFALNLVEGHVGEAECVAWTLDDVHPLAEGRFNFDPHRPLDPWHITTADGGTDLRFSPGAAHAEARNLGIIRSRFVQPAGIYEGTVRLGGLAGRAERLVEIEAMLGVAEDQDVLW